MTESVLLLAPSRGLGGGIERYVSTIESAFTQQQVTCQRLDLREPDQSHNTGTKLRYMYRVRQAVRASEQPVRLVVAHRNLLPVVRSVSRLPYFGGASVIVHGSELWSTRRVRGRRNLVRPDVRAVAVSNFSAGVLARTCPANVLPPGVSAEWYRTLVSAADRRIRTDGLLNVVTAFRLSQWREKGLHAVLHAVGRSVGRGVRLTVCGHGPAPKQLLDTVSCYPWCRIAPDLSDEAMAEQLAGADVFILGTRTRRGGNHCGEGFGLVLLEAQLAGTPVIAPAFGGSGDAFQPGITGVAPIDESAPALAAALDSLLEDGPRRTEMASAAAIWSRARFDPAGYSRRAVQVLLGGHQSWHGGTDVG